MTYIKLFVDCLDALQPLDDAERGRLFSALLEYAQTGEAPQLSGNERFVFPFLRQQVDRDAAAYAQLCEVRSAAGKKGAQARQNKQMPDLLSKAGKEEDKDKDEDKDQDKEEDKDHDKDEDDDKNGSAQALPAAVAAAYRERINPRPSEGSMRELADLARDMGEECCLRAFDLALDAQKPTWPYIRAILRAKREQGVRSLADWDRVEAQHDAQRVQRETQRSPARSRAMLGCEPGTDFQPTPERIRRNGEWLEKFLREQGGS